MSYEIDVLVGIAIKTIESLDRLAGKTDAHGRLMYTHGPTRLDFHIHRDGAGWVMTHRGDPVGQVRCAKTDDGVVANIVPNDESWEADCEDVKDILPSSWIVKILEPHPVYDFS